MNEHVINSLVCLAIITTCFVMIVAGAVQDWRSKRRGKEEGDSAAED